MPNLAQLTDYDPQSVVPEADGMRRVYITGVNDRRNDPTVDIQAWPRPDDYPDWARKPSVFSDGGLPVGLDASKDYAVAPNPNPVGEALGVNDIEGARPSAGSSKIDKIINALFRDDEKRYQLWPEKVVREALGGAHDVMQNGTNLGLRREDVTDIPAPDMPTKDSTWLGEKLGVAPVAASPQDSIIEKAQAISALAGTGGLGGVTDATLGATPFLRPALKHNGRLYKGKEGQGHQDIIPDALYEDFQKKAMSGEDISHYNFGFHNDKGHFLNREDALKYGIDTGIIDPHAGQYGALTSTLLADSSKPGTAIEAMAKAEPFFSALEHNVAKISQNKMTGEQWLGTLSNKPGVKPEELDWTGLKGYLQENGKAPVTKAQIEEHLANNKVELKEVEKGQSDSHFLHYKNDLEHNLRRFDNILPEFKSQADIALARQHNPHFRETVKGESNGRVWNAIQEAKKPLNYPKELFQQYDTRAEAEAAIKAAGAEAHLDIGKKSNYSDTKYHSYQLPGGENYREMLLTLPDKPLPVDKFAKQLFDQWGKKGGGKEWEKLTDVEKQPFIDMADRNGYLNTGENQYRSSHWDEPNILAHVRMNDRTIDGKKSLHLEEIQSDWHQQGRDKGYRPEQEKKLAELIKQREDLQKEGSALSPSDARYKEIYKELPTIQTKINEIGSGNVGVPDAPFKKSWHELALKRMIREAAEKGYDRLSWTPGEAQAARYDLSKSIGSLKATPIMDQNGLKYELRATNPSGTSEVLNSVHTADELPNIVGKEMAKKIVDETGGKHPKTFKDLDLKIGGEGMKGFYDKIIPNALEKLGKEHGVKVKQGEIPTANNGDTIISRNGYHAVANSHGNIIEKFDTKTEAKNFIAKRQTNSQIHYIDIPQSLRDTAMRKGFPLFSSTHIFTPVDHDPFEKKK